MFGARDVGVDLGTTSNLVYIRGRGIVLQEPSVVAIDSWTGRVVAIGEQARNMLGRTPANIVPVRPLRRGVIADYILAEAMLRSLIRRISRGRGSFRPRVVVSVPFGVTAVERQATVDAVMQAGARKAYLIEEPMAAAIGAGFDIFEPGGKMVMDIGGGTTGVAVLSLGGIVVGRSLRTGGDALDEAIVRYLRREHRLLVGERAAEQLKISIGTACAHSRQDSGEIRGRDLHSGLPRNLGLTSAEIHDAMRETLVEIVAAARAALEQTPPELVADIIDRGIVLTGGGALLHGLDLLIRDQTGVPAHVADDPRSCVAIGAGRALRDHPALVSAGS